MTSSNTYTGTRGNYLQKTTDGRGKVTTYAYNSSKGLLESVTAPNSAKTSYTYNANNDRLTKVASGNAKVEYVYSKDRLSEISADGGNVKYKLNYDARGRRTTTQVGTGSSFRTLSTNTWNTRDLLTKMTYGNGGQINYAYDNLDRVSQVWNTDTSKRVEYRYDAEGRLALTRDYLQDQQTRYTYDMAGRLVEVNNLSENWDQGPTRTKTQYQYEDGTNRIYRLDYSVPKQGSTSTYRSNFATALYDTGLNIDRLKYVRLNGSNRLAFGYDDLGRLTSRSYASTTGSTVRKTTYTYVAGANGSTTNLLATVNNAGFSGLTYTYDDMGNIKTIKEGSKTETYTYDSLGQLTRVDSQKENKSYTYSYDNRGNITSKKEYAYTTGTLGTATKTVSYAYGNTGWKDLLTSYNGQSITYDTIGNPLSYRGMTLTWANGRQLATLTKSGKTTSYEYDINGRRTKKVANGVTTEYYYSGEQYTGMHTSDGKDVGAILDASGSLYGIYYDDSTIGTDVGQTYYFVYNGQGDVIGLYNHGGKLIATYAYDAWGRCIEAKAVTADDDGHAVTDPDHIAFINPFRYRGYYYDAESGLYYLNSRYYDPETGRFLNADGLLGANGDTLSYNLFAYCSNNPVNFSDPSGYGFWSWLTGLFGGKKSNEATSSSASAPSGSQGACKSVGSAISQHDPAAVSPIGGIRIGNNQGTINEWRYRIDPPKTSTQTQRHIHIESGNKKYAQNEDGTRHDGSKGSPPNSVKKILKEKGVWDWDANAAKQRIVDPNDLAERYNILPDNYGGFVPVPEYGTIPFPATNPVFGPLPAPVYGPGLVCIW